MRPVFERLRPCLRLVPRFKLLRNKCTKNPSAATIFSIESHGSLVYGTTRPQTSPPPRLTYFDIVKFLLYVNLSPFLLQRNIQRISHQSKSLPRMSYMSPSQQVTMTQTPPNPNIRFGDMRYISDEPTTVLWGLIKSTPEWEEVCYIERNECRGTKRYKFRAGAANLVRYTRFYHTLRSRYLALHNVKSFDVSNIFDDLKAHLNEDYTLEMQEDMATVWCLLSEVIEGEARHDFFVSPSKFPLEVQIGGEAALNRFLGILIDLVISDLILAPHHFKTMIWDGLDKTFYGRAMANEFHQGFFTGPIIHPDVPSR